MNRVTLCSNCREKSREIIAYGEKLAAAEARLRECEEALRDMTARAIGHRYASDMAEGAATITGQELARERADHRETLNELRAAEASIAGLIAEIAKLRGDAGKGGGE